MQAHSSSIRPRITGQDAGALLVHFYTDQQNEGSVVPDTSMPLLLVVEVRANLAALELVAFVEAVDSLLNR
jgi:hypothetical protein